MLMFTFTSRVTYFRAGYLWIVSAEEDDVTVTAATGPNPMCGTHTRSTLGVRIPSRSCTQDARRRH